MNAAVVRKIGRSNALVGSWRGAVVVLLYLAAGGDAWALDGPQFEILASTLPRLGSADGSTRSSGIAVTWPNYSAGLLLGIDRPNTIGFSGAPYFSHGSNLDIGLHWRYTLDSNYRIDVKAWRRWVTPDAIDLVQSRQNIYGARVEMQIAAPRSGLVADFGFLGLQLEGGARLTLRRHSGGPMVYYRDSF
jgi:hypothetical protein